MLGNHTLSDLLKKYWYKIINYWLGKITIDIWEKPFDR